MYTNNMEIMKIEIKEFFERNHGKNIDYEDILKQFSDFGLDNVVEACKQLEKEGKIQVAEEESSENEKFFGENIKEVLSGLKRIWRKFKK